MYLQMKHLHMLLLVALLAIAVPVCNADVQVGKDAPMRNVSGDDKHDRRIVVNWDGDSFFWTLFKCRAKVDLESVKRVLEEMVAEQACAGVDVWSECVFWQFRTALPFSRVAGVQVDGQGSIPLLDEAGLDYFQILLESCHRHNMEMLACLRMNDRHSNSLEAGFYKQHPEWRLQGASGGMDYKHEEVRNTILAFTEEVLSRYDMDGIEYDYMRWCHMFEPGEGARHAHLLNDFTRKTRKLLDDAATRRGCERLLFGVRIPQIIGECEYLGFDIATWIKEGLVDFVVPTDFMHTDTNMKTEDFVKLCEGTDCKVYPGIHNRLAMDKPNEHYRLMDLSNLRAAAQNFYAFGADGISPYNYQFPFERRYFTGRSSAYAAYMWPAAIGWLADLRDPEDIAGHDRHYLFYPVFKKAYHKSPSGFFNDDNIYLDRAKAILEGARRFRMAEDMSNPRLRVTMQFKALGMAEGEKLEITINGAQVPIDYITRVFDKDGQSIYEGDPLPAFHEYTIDLNWETTGRTQPLVFGDNELAVKLVPVEAKSDGEVSVEELECYVYVRK